MSIYYTIGYTFAKMVLRQCIFFLSKLDKTKENLPKIILRMAYYMSH